MKIVVTGGAGFLGSNLCDKLIEQGHQVLCVDNLLTGSEKNIEHLLRNPNFHFINYDATVISSKILHRFAPQNNISQIYHLASPASPNHLSKKSYMALPFETILVNTTGTWNLCQLAMERKAKLLFASTSEVYGEPLEHPQKESYRGNVSSTGPRAVYDESKRFGETIVSAFIRYKNLQATTVRIFNTYGPRMAKDDGRVVISLMWAALESRPLKVYGDGKQTRSFCYISDLIEGLTKTMNSEKSTGEIFNLGNDQEFSILELAEKIKQVTNSSSNIEFTDELPEDAPSKRKPDITKAKNVLGWEPRVDLDEGLTKLMKSLNS